MAAHRFWRVSVRNAAFDSVNISEAQFRTIAGDAGSNQSGSATFTGMRYTDSYPPSNMQDGNTATAWEWAGTLPPLWFKAEWAVAVDVVELALRHGGGGGGGKPGFIFVDASDDGLVWTRASAQGDMSGVANQGTYLLAITDPISVDNNMAGGGLRIDTDPWPPTDDFGRMTRLISPRYDAQDGGPLEISGTVMIDDSPDIPVRRRVRLFERISGRLVRETWSDPVTGGYLFSGLKNQKYFVVSHDHTLFYNAVIKDEISPEVPA